MPSKECTKKGRKKSPEESTKNNMSNRKNPNDQIPV
jgi:hypothetical protein